MSVSHVSFTDDGPPVSDADIDAMEARLGIKLPEGYRAFLKEHNGGFVWPRHTKLMAIHYFLRIGDPENVTTLASVWHAYKDPEYPSMPPEFMPIACNSGGDYLCLVINGKKKGQIFFWDSVEAGVDTYTYDNLHFVADNIQALLESLYEDPEIDDPSVHIGKGWPPGEEPPGELIDIGALIFGDRTYVRDDGVKVTYDQDKFPVFKYEHMYPMDLPARDEGELDDEYALRIERDPPSSTRVELCCERVTEVAQANAALGLAQTPDGYCWHHSHRFIPQDGKVHVVMQLVRTDIHRWAEHAAGTHLARDIIGSKAHIGHTIRDILSSITKRFSRPSRASGPRRSPAQLSGGGAPASSADLDAFEARMGIELPRDYRAFLQAHNGGRPRPRVCHIRARLYSDVPIQYFLSLGPPYPLDDVWQALKDPTTPRLPPEMIPIAESDCGDVLCLAIDGRNRHQVFFWDHEQEGIEQYTRDNLFFIAPDIHSLLTSLSHR